MQILKPLLPDNASHEATDGQMATDIQKDLAQRRLLWRREVALTLTGLGITVLATLLLTLDMAGMIDQSRRAGALGTVLTQIGFALIFLGLIYGNILYQLTRLGYWLRLRTHRATPRRVLDTVYDEPSPPAVVMLVPAYREEVSVVRQALLSCALQEYPQRRVVLLIDDPYPPATAADREAMERMQQLPQEIMALLANPAARCGAAAVGFESRLGRQPLEMTTEIAYLAEAQEEVAEWYEAQATIWEGPTHTDALFVALTFVERARQERRRTAALIRKLPAFQGAALTQWLRREYRRLDCLFRVEVTSFERKQYVTLSHASNKAMNLNSYLGLLGKSWRETRLGNQLMLWESTPAGATLQVPAADFVLTLDADSLLAPDYTLRLTHVMRQPGHEQVAVVQTPYSAVPQAPGLLERMAGATTDMQYLIHQGFTAYHATFWVGANALLRMEALEDICTEEEERSYVIKRYIQDHTVIEDTESSIDLMVRGWSLYNYPERLSYSATPPDFGSLFIQRCRWANGGLLILPKLLRHLPSRLMTGRGLAEAFMRCHYLASILVVNLGVLILLMYPFEQALRIVWLPLTALPYYALYGWDLVLAGYRWSDLFRAYALNLLLLPVNLAGVGKSLVQGITGHKSSFSRTPKIAGKTLAPVSIVAAEVILTAYCLLCTLVDLAYSRWWHAIFALLNAGILAYAIVRFIGVADMQQQLGVAVKARFSPILQLWYCACGRLKSKG